MSEFEDYESVSSADERLTISKTSYRTSLSEQSRRLSNCINAMASQGNRVSFKLDRSIAAEVRELSVLEGVTLSEMCSQILIEYFDKE